MKEIIKAIT